MRIKSLSIKNLFGVFNHQLEFKYTNRVMLIHGPNGYGKTAILKIIHAIFNNELSYLRKLPFLEIIFTFDNETQLKISKLRPNPELKLDEISRINISKEIDLRLFSKGKVIGKHKLERINPKVFPLGMIDRNIDNLERVNDDLLWKHQSTGELFTLEDIADKYNYLLPERFASRRKTPDWLIELRDKINVKFIATERLNHSIQSTPSPFGDNEFSILPTVVSYSKDLVTLIQRKLSEYASHSQSLDRTFPSRLVDKESNDNKSINDLIPRLIEIDIKRRKLTSTGLLDKEEEIPFDAEKIREDSRNLKVLEVYIDDIEKKLCIFDELTNKIDTMINIINSRFRYKKMIISKEEGFGFHTFDNKFLPLIKLSSGEQHEIVLLYELLFKIEEDSLVLIDEPEISLHVAWQREFLNDLIKIVTLSKFDVLIATHSPQIIHDKWDLTIELNGPDDDRKPNTI